MGERVVQGPKDLGPVERCGMALTGPLKGNKRHWSLQGTWPILASIL